MALQSDCSNDADKEGPFEQFEKCDVKSCIYYNEEGYCSFETCRINNENPATASMVTKLCKFCGNKFAVNMNEMHIQACPACLEGFLKAEGHPHSCIFCGATLDGNPSIFWPVCGSCFGKIKTVALGNATGVNKAANMAHCDHCG